MFVLSALATACGQTASLWSSSTDGNWSESGNWSISPNYPNNNVPNFGDAYDAVVDVSGVPYTVTVASPVSVSSLTIDSDDVTVDIRGGILDTPMINLDQGMLSMGTRSFDQLNEIRNAVISGDGGFHIEYGTVRDVVLARDATFHLADIAGDLTLDNATVSVDGGLRFFGDQPQTLAGQGVVKFEDKGTLGFADLTIGPDVETEFVGGNHTLNGQRLFNQGTIRSVSSIDLINADVTNAGTIDVVGDARIGGSPFRNTGTIRVRQNAYLTLVGTMTTGDIGTIVDEGARQIVLGAELDNHSNTFDLASLNLMKPVALNGGTIRGGALTSSADVQYELQNAIAFDNVAIEGALSFMRGRVYVEGSLTLSDARFQLGDLSLGSPNAELNGTGTLVVESIAGGELVIGEQVIIRNTHEVPPGVPLPDLNVRFKTNRGMIIAEPNSRVIIGEYQTEWKNEGLIRVPDGQLEFRGAYSIDDIGTVQAPSSQVLLSGSVENTGKTIRLDETTGGWNFSGNVIGGRIESSGGVEAGLRSLFTGVTLSGPSRVGTLGGGTPNLLIYDELILDGATLSVPAGRSISFARDDDGNVAPLRGQGEIVLLDDQAKLEAPLAIEPGIVIRTGAGNGGTIGRYQVAVDNAGTIRTESDGYVLNLFGDLQNSGTLRAANESTLRMVDTDWTNQGTMELDDGRFEINSVSFENGANGLLTGTGDMVVSGLFFGDGENGEFLNNGELAVGSPVGNLNMEGRVRFGVTSQVAFDIGGTSDGEFDTLQIDGDLFVGGQLEVKVMDGFLLQPKQQYDVLETSGFVFGQFEGLAEGALVGTYDDVDLFITYSSGNGNDISLYTSFPGDFNSDRSLSVADLDALTAEIANGNNSLTFDLTGDGIVDIADVVDWLAEAAESNIGPDATYLIGDLDFNESVDSRDLGVLLNRFGESGTLGWSEGDINGDEIVDQADLGLLLNNFQRVATPAVVPEPSGFALLLSWMLCLACGGVRRS